MGLIFIGIVSGKARCYESYVSVFIFYKGIMSSLARAGLDACSEDSFTSLWFKFTEGQYGSSGP